MSDNQFDKKNHGFKNDYDRFDTLEFTEEDLKKLRQPNPRIMDSDYFDREIKGEEKTKQDFEIEPKEQEPNNPVDDDRDLLINSKMSEEQELSSEFLQASEETDREVKELEKKKPEDQLEVSKLDAGEDEIEAFSLDSRTRKDDILKINQEDLDFKDPADHLKETLELELDPDIFYRHDFEQQSSESNEDENPFQYRSIKESLREEHRNKRVANVRPGFFQRVFQTVFSTRDDFESDTFSDHKGEEPYQAEDCSNTFEVEPLNSDGNAYKSEKNDEDHFESDKSSLAEESVSEENKDLEFDEKDGQVQEKSCSSEEEKETVGEENSLGHENQDLISNSKPLSPQIFVSSQADQPLETNDEIEKTEQTQEADPKVFTMEAEENLSTASIETSSSKEKDHSNPEESHSEEITYDSKKPSQTKMYDEEELEALAWDILPEDHYLKDDATTSKEPTFIDKVKIGSKNAWAKLAKNSSRLMEKTKQSTSQMLQTVQDRQDNTQDLAENHEGPAQIEGIDNQEKEANLAFDHTDHSVLKRSVDQALEVNDENENNYIKETVENISLTEDEAIAEGISQKTASYEAPILTDAILEDTLDSNLREADMTQQQLNDQYNSQDKSKFVAGAAWLSMGQILSRIIGALYIIPWATWLGAEYSQANSLYAVGYNPYVFFLSIAVAGFPAAVAKQIAFYSTKKEFKVVDKLFKYSLGIMATSGIIIAAIFYFIAPTLVANSPTDNQEAAIIVVRSLAPALLILPTLSLFKGYFQGYSQMIPLALSEVLEQIIRVLYILGATYLIMMVYKGSITEAVAHSTFAAFVGALMALLFLVSAYVIHNKKMKSVKETSLNKMDIDFMDSLKIMLRDSIPFILLGSGIIFAQNIDTYTFKQILVRTSVLLNSEIAELFGAMSLDVNKLIMIIVSFAVAIAASSIPAVSSKYAEGNINKTSELIKNIVLLFTFIMLPASIGMAIIADNVYPFFYPAGIAAGPGLLATGSFTAIVLGAYTVFATILQSMDYRRFAITYLLVGLAIKLILQFPMVALFHAHGALLATFFGFAVSAVLMWMKIWRVIKIRDRYFVGDIVRIVIATTIMAIGTYGWNRLINQMMDPVGRGLTFVQIILVVLIAIIIYGGVMALFGMLPIIIGDYQADLQKKLSMHR